ncbi:c-type cytochrome biogenesis protein CcsB, partial [Burkholderia ubonensis]
MLAPGGARPFLLRLDAVDWLFALAMLAGAGFALTRYAAFMNGYDEAVLIGAVPALVTLGWRWKPARLLMASIAALALLSIRIYQGDLARADSA